jgi:hypothetical protein
MSLLLKKGVTQPYYRGLRGWAKSRFYLSRNPLCFRSFKKKIEKKQGIIKHIRGFSKNVVCGAVLSSFLYFSTF